MKELLRSIPAIHEIQQTDHFRSFINLHNLSNEKGTDLVKMVISSFRHLLIDGKWTGPLPDTTSFLDMVFTKANELLKEKYGLSLQKVINASGTVLHTNLGRARLGCEAIEHIGTAAGSYSNLEYDINSGSRESRHSHAEKFICELTGAESAMVVNNNAAAVFIILSALAKSKEVLVSRGELVEIGGSFRISSIMEESGARLVEVGTTNKTHLFDYENNIGEETAMLMKVHQSNFVIKGFTSSVKSEEVVELTHKYPNLVYYEDLGSGALYDFSKEGIGDEPIVKAVIEKGVDLVSFSGDKLLGGPQAGIIAGKKSLIEKLKKHQLARVLRVDKMTLAALETTLLHYMKGEAKEKIPTIKGITRSSADIHAQSQHFVSELTLHTDFILEILPGKSKVGGGTMPDVELETFLISIQHHSFSCEELHEKLRIGNPAIISRIHKNLLFIDLRAVTVEEQSELLQKLIEIYEQTL